MKDPLNLLIRACITLLPPIMGIIVQVNLKWICKFFGFGGNWYFMHHIILMIYYLVDLGFESPSEWEDQYRILGVDGPDVQYTVSLTTVSLCPILGLWLILMCFFSLSQGGQDESFPYVYYNYGYAQSPYNPYNPYIPGAVVGFDGSYDGGQSYYTLPNYQNPASLPAYDPLVQPNNFLDSSANSLFGASASASRTDGRGLKQKFNEASGNFSRNSLKLSSNQTSSVSMVSEGQRANNGRKQDLTHASVSGGRSFNVASSAVHQV